MTAELVRQLRPLRRLGSPLDKPCHANTPATHAGSNPGDSGRWQLIFSECWARSGRASGRAGVSGLLICRVLQVLTGLWFEVNQPGRAVR